MKLPILLTIIFCTIFFRITAQTTFSGMLLLKTQAPLKYKLVLNIDSISKNVSGYSITDEKGKEETKTLLKGKIDFKKKKIDISEYQIESTKAKAKDIVFCFIEASLSIGMKDNDTTLIGQFTGKLFPKNEVCGTGGIFIKQSSHTKKKNIQTIAKVTKEKSKPEIIKPVEKIEPKSEEKIDLKTFTIVDQNTAFNWKSDSVVIELWDQGNQDQDIVSLFVDGNLIADNITLSSKRIYYHVKLSTDKVHTISVLAENEGIYPPNTAAMIITDGNKKYTLMCQSQLNEMKTIRLNK